MQTKTAARYKILKDQFILGIKAKNNDNTEV